MAQILAGVVLTAAPVRPTPSILVVPATQGARAVCEGLIETFTNEKVRVKLAGEKSDAVRCIAKPAGPTRRTCLVEALRGARADAIVVLSTTGRGAQVTVGLQLLSRVGEAERQETLRGARARLPAMAQPAIARTIATLRAVLLIEETHAMTNAPTPGEPPPAAAPTSPTPAPRPVDVPTSATELVLAPPAAPLALELRTPAAVVPPKPRGAAWAVTALAVVGAGTAGTFGALGATGKARLDQTSAGISELRYTEATALRDNSNLQLSIALSAGITAGVAAVIAGVLWAQ
jgi:hypothetical protein